MTSVSLLVAAEKENRRENRTVSGGSNMHDAQRVKRSDFAGQEAGKETHRTGRKKNRYREFIFRIG